MEAVPKLPLISFQLKASPEPTEFNTKLKQYIRSFYNEDPEAYNKEIRDLEILRQSACRVQMDFTGCGTLKKYYAQLQLLQSRFPMTEDGVASVTFVWSDIYSSTTWRVSDIKQEQACILHNIGALHSELGAVDSRQTSEGMKISCTHFQCAAWAFQHLRDNLHRSKSSDMSQDVLSFYIAVMLGQAQECILEKSMLDNRKSTIVAKIAAQIVDYYKQALKTLDVGAKGAETSHVATIVGAKLYKYWKKYLEFKIAYHYCVTYLYMGNQAEELQKMGERVAYYQGALEKLNDAVKLSKGLEKEVSDALTFTMDVVGGKFNAASKENEFVYHEKVPALDTLPEIKGASLVKGIPFDPADPEISGPDIFARLVPMEAHKASSLYSEEKAKLLRMIASAIEEKDQALTVYLSSLQLETLRLIPEPNSLPQELVDCCAALSVRPNAIKDLVVAMQSLSSIFHDVDSLLGDIQALVEEEEKQEKECQEVMGKRPPSMIILEMKKELSKYQEAHQKASESNVTLHKAMDYHIANLNLLSGPLDELMKLIPSMDILDAPNNEGVGKELQRLVNKVEEMRIQRQMLEHQLREQIQLDDITKQLVTNEDLDLQEVFVQEIQKHDRQIALINQNLAAQDNILKALTEVNASYADTRRATNEIAHRRETMIQNLIATYEAYEDLVSKSQKGLDFYRKLESSATKLLQRARSVCKVQEEERSTMMMKQVKKVPKDRPAAAKPTPATSAASGPKLKDYLQFMQPGMGGQMRLPGSGVPTVPSVNSASASHHDFTGNQMYSVNYERPGTIPASGYELEASLPSEMRPTPVGSEQADIPQSFCSTSRGLFSESGKITSLDDYSRKRSASYGEISSGGAYQSNMKATSGSTKDKAYADPAGYSLGGQYIGAAPSDPNVYSGNQQYPYQSAGMSHQGSDGSYQQTPGTSMWYPGSSRGNSHFPVSSSVYTSRYQNYPGYNSSPSASQSPYQNTNTVESNYSHGSAYPSYPTDGYGATVPGDYRQQQQQATFIPQQSEPIPSNYPAQQTQPIQGNFQPQQAHAIPNNFQPQQQTVSASNNYPQHQTQQAHPAPSNYPAAMNNIPGTYSVADQQSKGAVNPNGYPPTSFGYSSDYASGRNTETYGQYAIQEPSAYGGGGAAMAYPVQDRYETPQSFSLGHDQSVRQNAYLPMQQPLQPQIPGTATSTYTQSLGEKGVTTPIQAQPQLDKALDQPRRDSNLDILQQLDFSNAELQPTQQKNATASDKTANKDILAGNNLPVETSSILIPKVLTMSGMSKDKDSKDSEVRKSAAKDPFLDKETLEKFVIDVERFQKVVEGLSKQSLNGPTPLDQKWKELMDTQDRESRKLSISVARCCSMKNRMPDIMPYDNSRVVIATLKDDYINASYLKNLSKNTPQYIAAQAPLQSTYRDFWVMIYEQQTEVIAAVISDAELKGDIYWPSERGQPVDHDILTLSLQSIKKKAWGVERVILITQRESRNSRAVIHLQFTGWPPGGIPSSPAQFLQFVADVHGQHREQRNTSRPVVVHCSSGVGRTGVFCLVSAAMHEVNAGSGIVDLWSLAARMTQMRKYIMQDKEHMRFCFHAVLYFAEDCLLKRGILIKRASFDDKVSGNVSHKSHTRHPSQDFILGPGHEEQQASELSSKPTQSSLPVTTSKQSEISDDTEKTLPASVRSRSNSNASLGSASSTGSSSQGHYHTSASPQHHQPQQSVSLINLPPNLANLDAAHFTLEPVTRKTSKITKDSFASQGGGIGNVTDPNDPLSQLDPLWSLHK